MRRLLIVTNAEAGSSDEETIDAVVGLLRERAADVVVRATSGEGDLRVALSDRDGRDVVVAGGDGSLHAVVDVLHSLDDLAGPEVTLVPMGTGNDFARGTGIPVDAEAAALLILEGAVRPVDLIVDDRGHVVVNAVHLGIGVAAALKGEPIKRVLGKVRLGRLGYPLGAFVAALTAPGWPVRVTVDDEVVHDGRALQVGVTNGTTIGGGTELAPGAEPADGMADVVVSQAVGRLARYRYGWGLLRGTHEQHLDVQHWHGTRVVVEALSGSTFRINADGELSDKLTRREWTVLPRAMTMRLPG